MCKYLFIHGSIWKPIFNTKTAEREWKKAGPWLWRTDRSIGCSHVHMDFFQSKRTKNNTTMSRNEHWMCVKCTLEMFNSLFVWMRWWELTTAVVTTTKQTADNTYNKRTRTNRAREWDMKEKIENRLPLKHWNIYYDSPSFLSVLSAILPIPNRFGVRVRVLELFSQ